MTKIVKMRGGIGNWKEVVRKDGEWCGRMGSGGIAFSGGSLVLQQDKLHSNKTIYDLPK